MYSGTIITGVEIYDPLENPGTRKRETYLVLVGEPREAAEFLGSLKSKASSMQNLVDWAQPGAMDEFVLLISLDGRRGEVFPKYVVRQPGDFEQVFKMEVFDNYYPHEVKRLIKDFENYIIHDPKLAADIGYVAPTPKVTRRVRFDRPGINIEPGAIHNDILEAIRNLEGASDDALVWLAIAGPENKRCMYSFDYDAVSREIELRHSKNMSFRATFFPLNKVSREEIERRQKRAQILLTEFKAKCDKGDSGFDYDEAERWIRRLDNDKLGELAVYTFYSDAGRMGEWKHFVAPFQARMRSMTVY